MLNRADRPRDLFKYFRGNAAYGFAQRIDRLSRVEIKDVLKFFLIEEVLRVIRTSCQQCVFHAGCRRLPETHFDVKVIILFQKAALNDVAKLPAVSFPVFPRFFLRNLFDHGFQAAIPGFKSIGKLLCNTAAVSVLHRPKLDIP